MFDAIATPSHSVQSVHLRNSAQFLYDIEPLHGPIELFERFFLRATAAALQQGVSLSFISMDELLAVNAANKDTWRPLVPIFDSRINNLGSQNAYAFVGRNSKGRIVAAQAGRLFDWRRSNFRDEITTLRLFFDNPADAIMRGESVTCDVDRADKVTGLVNYSGATWFHPEYRGTGLGYLMARISRVLAHTRWNTDCTISVMAEGVVKGGYARRCGYTDVRWGVQMNNFDCVETAQLALVVMPRHQIISDIEGFDRIVDEVLTSASIQQLAHA